jgi:excisionase family DNA binding protein
MTARFLSLNETAEKLGMSTDDILRLVDRKQLYPIKDGGSLKFKAEDLDTFLSDRNEDADTSEDVASVAIDDNADVSLELESPDAGTVNVEAIEQDSDGSSIELASDVSLDLGDSGPQDHLAEESTPALELDLGDDEVASGIDLELDEQAENESDVLILEDADNESVEPEKESPISDLSDIEIDSEKSGSTPELLLSGSGDLSENIELDGSAIADENISSLEIDSPALDDLSNSDKDKSAGSLVLGDEDELAPGSNISDNAVGSALSDVLDSGVLIEEKEVELEGVQAWDEVDLGIEDELEPEQEDPLEEPLDFGDDLQTELRADIADDLPDSEDAATDEDFDLGAGDDGSSVDLDGDASASFDLPAGSGESSFEFADGMMYRQMHPSALARGRFADLFVAHLFC